MSYKHRFCDTSNSRYNNCNECTRKHITQSRCPSESLFFLLLFRTQSFSSALPLWVWTRLVRQDVSSTLSPRALLTAGRGGECLLWACSHQTDKWWPRIHSPSLSDDVHQVQWFSEFLPKLFKLDVYVWLYMYKVNIIILRPHQACVLVNLQTGAEP